MSDVYFSMLRRAEQREKRQREQLEATVREIKALKEQIAHSAKDGK